MLIDQLALAGRGRRRNVIVVLANREPSELSHEVRSGATALHGARLVFRWGDPTRVDDLAIVALADARTVIVLADDEAGDFNVVKAVLAAGVELGRFDIVPIVAEVGDLRTGQDLVRACGGMVYPFAPTQALPASPPMD